jgi:hypothetical protein
MAERGSEHKGRSVWGQDMRKQTCVQRNEEWFKLTHEWDRIVPRIIETFVQL